MKWADKRYGINKPITHLGDTIYTYANTFAGIFNTWSPSSIIIVNIRYFEPPGET